MQAQRQIMRRRWMRFRQEVRLVEAQTKILVAAVHGAGGNKNASQIASSIDFLPPAEAVRTEQAERKWRASDLPSVAQVSAMFGPPVMAEEEPDGGARVS